MNRELVRAIVIVKKAAAGTYLKLKIGNEDVESAIINACDHILNHECDMEACFPLQALQGGGGDIGQYECEKCWQIWRSGDGTQTGRI